MFFKKNAIYATMSNLNPLFNMIFIKKVEILPAPNPITDVNKNII